LESDFTFARSVRLTQALQYRQVFANPIRTVDRYFTLLATSNNTDGARLGLAVSKKSIRKASGRNRIKRQIRESFRHTRIQLPAIDIVVMAKFGAEKIPSLQIRNSLEQHWIKLTRLCEKSS